MTKYNIQPKRDFGSGKGFFIGGKFVKRGFVVTDGLCNVMPGATWFQTIPHALHAISCLEASRGDSDKFWRLIRA